MPFDGAGQHLAFGVAALGCEVFHGFAVVHTGHILLDDGAFVQVGRDVVGGGADQLHTPVVGLVVRLGALEAGQKRVVDVDGTPGQFAAQVVAQDLHVTRQHHQLGAFSLDDLVLLGFGLRLVVFGHRDVVEGHVVAGRQLVKLTVVADDGADVQRQQATFPAEQQVVQAVTFFADHDHGSHRLGGGVQVP